MKTAMLNMNMMMEKAMPLGKFALVPKTNTMNRRVTSIRYICI